MRVIFKANGQQYDIPDNKFDPNVWESADGNTPAKKEGMSQYAPIIGQILGGIGGGLVGGPVGAVAGAGAGGAVGEGIHQKVEGEQTNVGKMAKEGLWGVGGELTGLTAAKLASKLLGKGATSLASKSIGASPTQSAKFLSKTGKNIGDFATAEGLLTRNVDDISKAINPVNEAYGKLASSETTKIAKKDLLNSFLDEAITLEKSPLPASQSRAKKLYDMAANVDAKFGDVIGGDDLQKLKIEYGKEAGLNRFNGGKQNLYKTAEDITRKGLYDAAGNTTEKINIGGKVVDATLPQIGAQQKNLMALQDVVKKTSGKGMGSELFGLGALGRSGTGAGAGAGLSIMSGEKDPGIIARNALIGAGLSSLASNPKVLGTLVKGMSSGGKAMTEAASMVAGSKAPIVLTLLSQATGQGVKSVVQPTANNEPNETGNGQIIQPAQAGNNEQSETNQNVTGQEPIISQGGQWKWDTTKNDWVPNTQTTEERGSVGGLTPDKLKQLMVMDLIQNGGKNLSKLESLSKVLSTDKKQMSAAATQVAGKSTAGLNALDKMEKIIQKDPTILAKNAVPGTPGAREYAAYISSITDAIGGLRTGASVSPNQQKFYEKMLPQVFDSPATIKAKIEAVRKELQGYADSNVGDNSAEVLQGILNPQ